MDLTNPKLDFFVPSEVARLVLGYLKENNMKKTFNCFLRECPHLQEYMQLLRRGVIPSTDIMGYSLKEMLNGFAAVVLMQTRSERTLTLPLPSSSTAQTMKENEQHKHLRKNPAPGPRKHVSLQGSSSHTVATLKRDALGNDASILVNPSEAQNSHSYLNLSASQGQTTCPAKESYLPSSVRSASAQRGAGRGGVERDEVHGFNTSGNENFEFLDRLLEDTQLPQLLAENINKALHVNPASSTEGISVFTASTAPSSTLDHHETNTVMKTAEAKIDNIIEMTESDPAFHHFLKVFHCEAPSFGPIVEEDHSKDGFRTSPALSATQEQVKDSISEPVSKDLSSAGNRESCVTPVVNSDAQKQSGSEDETGIPGDVRSTQHELCEPKVPSSCKQEGHSSEFAASSKITDIPEESNPFKITSSWHEMKAAETDQSPAKESKKVSISIPAETEKDQAAGSTSSISIIPESSSESSSKPIKPSEIAPDENSLSVFSLISKKVAEMSGEVPQNNVNDLQHVTSKNEKHDLDLNSNAAHEDENMLLQTQITSEQEHSGKSSSAGFSPVAGTFTNSGCSNTAMEFSDAAAHSIQCLGVVSNPENSSKNTSEITSEVNTHTEGSDNNHNAEELQQNPSLEQTERESGNEVIEAPSSETEKKTEVEDVLPTTIEKSWEKVDTCLTSCLRSIESGRDLQSLHAPALGSGLNETVDLTATNQTVIPVQQTENGNKEKEPETFCDSKQNGVDGEIESVSSRMLVKQCGNESESSAPPLGQHAPQCLRSKEKKLTRNYNTLTSPPRMFRPQSDKNSPREIRARTSLVQDHCVSLPASFSSYSRKEDKSQNFYPGLPNGKSSAFMPVTSRNQVNLLSKPNPHRSSKARSPSPPRSEQKTVFSFSSDLSPVIPAHCRKAPTRRIKPVEVSYSTPSPLQESVPPSPMDLVIDFQASPAATPGYAHFMSPRDSNGSNSGLGPQALPVDSRKNRSPHGESSAPGSVTPKQRQLRVSARKPKPLLPSRSMSYVDGSSLTRLGIKLPASPSRRKPRRIVPTLLSPSIPKDSNTSFSSPLKPEDGSQMDDAKTLSSSSDVSSNFSPLEMEAFRQLKSFLSSSYSKPHPSQEITSTISKAAENSHKTQASSNEVSKCGCASREVCRHLKGRNRKNKSPKKRNPQSDPILLKVNVEALIGAKTLKSKAARSESCAESPKERASNTVCSSKKRVCANHSPKLQDLGTCSATTAMTSSAPTVTSSDKSRDAVAEESESYHRNKNVVFPDETGEVPSTRNNSVMLGNDHKTDCLKAVKAKSKSLLKETSSFIAINNANSSASSSPASCHSFTVVGTVERGNTAPTQSPQPINKEDNAHTHPPVHVSASSQTHEKRKPVFSFINKLRQGFTALKQSGNSLHQNSVSDTSSKELDSDKKTGEDRTAEPAPGTGIASSQACDSEKFLSEDGSKVEEGGVETSKEVNTVRKGKTEESRSDGVPVSEERTGEGERRQNSEEHRHFFTAVKEQDEMDVTSERADYKKSGREFEKIEGNESTSPPSFNAVRRIIFSTPEKASESMTECQVEISRTKSVESISSFSHTVVSSSAMCVPSTATVLGQSRYTVSTPVTCTSTISNCQLSQVSNKASFEHHTVQTAPQDLNVLASPYNYAKGTFSALMSSSVSASDIVTSPVFDNDLPDCLSGALRLANGIESHEYMSAYIDGSPVKRTCTELKPVTSPRSSRVGVVNSPCSGSLLRQAIHQCNISLEGSCTALSPSQSSTPTLSSFTTPAYTSTLQTVPAGVYNQTSAGNSPAQSFVSTPPNISRQGLYTAAQHTGHANIVKILPKLNPGTQMFLEHQQLLKLSNAPDLRKLAPKSSESATPTGLPSTPVSDIVLQQTPTGSVIVLPPNFNLFQTQSCSQPPNARNKKRELKSALKLSPTLNQEEHSLSSKSKSPAVEKGETVSASGSKRERRKISKTKLIFGNESLTNNENPSRRTSEKVKTPKNKSGAICEVDQKQKQRSAKTCEKLKPGKKINDKGKSKTISKSPSTKKTGTTSVHKKVGKQELSEDLSNTETDSIQGSKQYSDLSNSSYSTTPPSGTKTNVIPKKDQTPKLSSKKEKLNESKPFVKSNTSEKSQKATTSKVNKSDLKYETQSDECLKTQKSQHISHCETPRSRKKASDTSKRKQTPRSTSKKREADFSKTSEIVLKSTTESKRKKRVTDKASKSFETEIESKHSLKKVKRKTDLAVSKAIKDICNETLEEKNDKRKTSELKFSPPSWCRNTSNSSCNQSPCYLDFSNSKFFTNDPAKPVPSSSGQLFALESDDSYTSDDIFLGNKKCAAGPRKNKTLRSDDESEIDMENSSSSMEKFVSTWHRKKMEDSFTALNSPDRESADMKSVRESERDGEPPAKRRRKGSDVSAVNFKRHKREETKVISGKEIEMTVDNESGALVSINPVLFDMFDSMYMKPSPPKKRKRQRSPSEEDTPEVVCPPQQEKRTMKDSGPKKRVKRKISLEKDGKIMEENKTGEASLGKVLEPQKLNSMFETDVKSSNLDISTLESLGATYIDSMPVNKLKLLLEAGDAARTFIEIKSESCSVSSLPKVNCIENCKGKGRDYCVKGSGKRKCDITSCGKQRHGEGRHSSRKAKGASTSFSSDQSSNSKTRSGKIKQGKGSKTETKDVSESETKVVTESKMKSCPDSSSKQQLLGCLDLQETESAVAALKLSMGENSVSVDWFALMQNKALNEVDQTGDKGDKSGFNSGVFSTEASEKRQHRDNGGLDNVLKDEREPLHNAVEPHSFSKGHPVELGNRALQSSIHDNPQRSTETSHALHELQDCPRQEVLEDVGHGTVSGDERCKHLQESPYFLPEPGPSLATSSTPGSSLLAATSSTPVTLMLTSSTPGLLTATSSTCEPSLLASSTPGPPLLPATATSSSPLSCATAEGSAQSSPASASRELKLMLKKKKRLLEKLH